MNPKPTSLDTMRCSGHQMTEELDAVLFDAGGVLWDMSPSVEDMFAEALDGLGKSVGRARLREAVNKADRLLDDEFAKLGGGDETVFWRRFDSVVLGQLGVDVDADRFAQDLSAEIRGVVTRAESWVAFPDAVPALEAVRGMGLRTGMVSNATELARRVLRGLDMERYLDAVVISDEVGVRKPEPRIFEIALGLVRAAPSRAVFLGDRPATDLVGATGAGLRGILVDRRDTFPDSRFVRVRNLDELQRVL